MLPSARRVWSLNHYQILDSLQQDQRIVAQTVAYSLHYQSSSPVRTMVFLPGVSEITKFEEWAREFLGDATKVVVMHAKDVPESEVLFGDNTLILCTDFAG